ncbi:SRP-independent targeting protein 2/TMEM208 protein [Dioscorea alata]|uniref:SRP-independent targeting protein 2/TMEM208 protein n=1 Tax=Dioscorea alata TaxID=55571 RepID=A0ACB7WR83_DIOAL|nr:SRP-independent targeting protein 2/TMEM208 protein [Dioscorea alata]
MANQGAKKRKEENKQHMIKLLRLIIACNVIYVLVRMLIFHSTFTWKHWIGLFVTSLAYGISYQQLANMAKATYSNSGELVDGGFDMSTGGVCGYLHDVIYITSFVQVTSIISGKFWWVYLVIPAFAGYKILGFAKGFLSLGSEGDTEDEKSRKKREKMERRASRGKFIKTRTK